MVIGVSLFGYFLHSYDRKVLGDRLMGEVPYSGLTTYNREILLLLFIVSLTFCITLTDSLVDKVGGTK